MLRGSNQDRVRVAKRWAAVAAAWLAATVPLLAAPPGVHYRHRGDMSPGAIGHWQLRRGGPLPGYFQPVEIAAPSGAMISLVAGGTFTESEISPLRVAMQVGGVYRLRVTNIPLHPGREVYPTIELIDRIYPPRGFEHRFPIPVELTQEDLELALEGKFVTRVIYLEDPQAALPTETQPGHTQWFDAGPGHDPLQLADNLGRPVAILRLGGRVPLSGGVVDPLMFRQAPPWLPMSRDLSRQSTIVPDRAGRSQP